MSFVIAFMLAGGQIAFEPGILEGGRVPTYSLEKCEERRKALEAEHGMRTICMAMEAER